MHKPALTLAAYPGRAALMDPNGNMQLAQYNPSYFTEQDYINDILLNGNGRPGYTFLAISPTEVRVIVNKAKPRKILRVPKTQFIRYFRHTFIRLQKHILSFIYQV